ncbi:MAG TPA: long-chain fatty acid--CoA ligase [Neisseriales bacterium]|jgi:long-chain acyl-CoA synthetase|nr:long-chain fatty acid--CoA ligase [Neisseriales bacterium]
MAINYPVNNFYQIIQQNAERSPRRIALFEDDLKISNEELLCRVDKVAAYLCDLEIKQGDKVALVMSNSWQFVVNLFAISKVGAVAVPVNNFLKHDELVYVINDSQTKLLFASAKYSDEVRDLMIKTNVEKIIWVDGLPLENETNLDYTKIFIGYSAQRDFKANRLLDDLAVLIYTSGTTGKPKGAMLSYRNLLSIVYGAFEHFQIKAGQARFICYLPMFHAFTLAVTLLLPLASNSGLVVVRSISTKKDFKNLLKLVLVHRCRYFAGVPDIFSAMARAKLPWYFHWFHNVRGWVSGAAPLSEDVIQRFSANFKRGQLLQGYGLSECASGVSLNQPWANKFGSVGRPLPSFVLEAFGEDLLQLPRGEVGELWVKGDCVMQGYFNRPEDSAEVLVGEWFKTGDIGYVDESGFIYIVDRKKDLIINKGMNIYPREIEEFIYTHEKVNACAVVGLKDIEENETPIAYIELKDGESATEREFKEFLKPLLAPFKQPRKIYFLDKLPRNATGKILKRELRDLQK